ncbi:hypothetical protein LPJ63_000231 [Coemansia sp. RSA 2711]|nr:hypothetical protein LPJ63_000231 [Coemansia sp. RSA 2711]KAJ2311176.1 hypothetical protein IWW52_005205 [Coemansia sp. RSA 2704]KAJ2359363.1 hypothetical protein H4S01_006155 [Coemansia sp. RSA 2610]KAJ2375451.1 hypothetical protein H4S02_008219 [Coemansia sp. RSA 2611]
MDVTKDNFAKALGEFKAAVGACDFAALDMEMTGLYEAREHQPSRLDTCDARYAKLKRSVEAFGVVQVGVCLFTWVGDCYEARPFNFNVFPASTVGGADADVHFACKSSALEFLGKSGFDFNKWVYQGIPYLRSETAERIRAERTQLLTSRQRAMPDDPFVADLERALAAFMASARQSLLYETANSYQRKLVYDAVSSHDTLGTRSRAAGIEIFKGSRRAIARLVASKVRALDACVDGARGFTAIIDLLSAARKPVVGHNMLLDVLHAYSKFVRDLPPTRPEFARAVAGFLPVLIDTKYIIESTPAIKAKYGTSNLDEIAPALEAAGGAAPIRFHARFTRNVSHTMHEAGFDAYMTGATFIRLLDLGGGLDLAPELVLYRYINKLYAATTEGMSWNVSC